MNMIRIASVVLLTTGCLNVGGCGHETYLAEPAKPAFSLETIDFFQYEAPSGQVRLTPVGFESTGHFSSPTPDRDPMEHWWISMYLAFDGPLPETERAASTLTAGFIYDSSRYVRLETVEGKPVEQWAMPPGALIQPTRFKWFWHKSRDRHVRGLVTVGISLQNSPQERSYRVRLIEEPIRSLAYGTYGIDPESITVDTRWRTFAVEERPKAD